MVSLLYNKPLEFFGNEYDLRQDSQAVLYMEAADKQWKGFESSYNIQTVNSKALEENLLKSIGEKAKWPVDDPRRADLSDYNQFKKTYEELFQFYQETLVVAKSYLEYCLKVLERNPLTQEEIDLLGTLSMAIQSRLLPWIRLTNQYKEDLGKRLKEVNKCSEELKQRIPKIENLLKDLHKDKTLVSAHEMNNLCCYILRGPKAENQIRDFSQVELKALSCRLEEGLTVLSKTANSQDQIEQIKTEAQEWAQQSISYLLDLQRKPIASQEQLIEIAKKVLLKTKIFFQIKESTLQAIDLLSKEAKELQKLSISKDLLVKVAFYSHILSQALDQTEKNKELCLKKIEERKQLLIHRITEIEKFSITHSHVIRLWNAALALRKIPTADEYIQFCDCSLT